jgi:uncharacterized protein (TIGR00299 family) protein
LVRQIDEAMLSTAGDGYAMKSQRIIYLDPFSGISGDMMLGALIDLGVSLGDLTQKLNFLPLRGYRLAAERCVRAGIAATKFEVSLDSVSHTHAHPHERSDSHNHRSFKEIRDMIESSSLSSWVKQKAIEAFRKLAEAEGKIHSQAPESVHFHEVGAVDSIVDIVGTMIALEGLLPARILSASVNVGQGILECRHGFYPVPGPAAQELLRGIPTFANSVTGELTTPTGATLLATLVEAFGPRPAMQIVSTGYGAGTQETPGNANVLRITIAEQTETLRASLPDTEVVVLEATIDDMNPQLCGYVQEKALAAGALDVYFTPIQMKKNRPAIKLTILCSGDQIDIMSGLIFTETTTIGLRYMVAQRRTLQREFQRVETEYGTLTMKVSYLNGKCLNFIPEYEDCRRVAVDKGIPLKEVMAAGIRSYLNLAGDR